MAQSCWALGLSLCATIATMNPHRLRLLLGSFVLCNVLLAAPHKKISGIPSEVAQNKEVSKEQKFIINETATSDKKKSVYGDSEKPMSSTGQITNGDITYGDKSHSGEKQGTGEMAGLKAETDKAMNLAPASPPPSERPSKMPELEDEDGDDYEDEDDDDEDAEAEEAQEADDDYDAAEAAEEADDDNGGDNGEDK
ncbi:hypothetical protein JD844_019405 [Phrynosoma platyrhinos]|uniref:Uncharacterized protein n=1 Tax=Phrynosoma platyrhinos TaxID=52577 RepID=A0ABQ7SPU7_PHRPL|nr:hypothetical protein JD844_019405 [Phrynosoma platyrhinos]